MAVRAPVSSSEQLLDYREQLRQESTIRRLNQERYQEARFCCVTCLVIVGFCLAFSVSWQTYSLYRSQKMVTEFWAVCASPSPLDKIARIVPPRPAIAAKGADSRVRSHVSLSGASP